MSRAILLLFFTVISTYYTVFAFFVGTDNTIIDIIDRLPLIFSPIYITYLLVVIVCIGLFYFSIKAFTLSVTLIQLMLFIINSLLQIVSIYYWYNNMPMYALLALTMLIVGLFILYITFPLMKLQLMLRLPIALWYSWTVLFTLLTFNYNMIIYEWSGFNLTDGLWAVILLTIGAAFALHLRYHYYDRLAPIIFIIFYIGIIFNNGLSELFVSAAALFLIGVMVVGFMFIKKKKTLQ